MDQNQGKQNAGDDPNQNKGSANVGDKRPANVAGISNPNDPLQDAQKR